MSVSPSLSSPLDLSFYTKLEKKILFWYKIDLCYFLFSSPSLLPEVMCETGAACKGLQKKATMKVVRGKFEAV